MPQEFVIGVDFGTDSVRALILDAEDGQTIAAAESIYPRWSQGRYQNPDRKIFRQHPLDTLEAFEDCMQKALSQAGDTARRHVIGIAVDSTGSTPCPVDETGKPLALVAGFEENPNAMFHLWKDHSATVEAVQINQAFSEFNGQDFTKYMGEYISEWFWSKILHVIHEDPPVANATSTWVEHCDWVPAILCGKDQPDQLTRSACAAGHKALWHSEWGGLPDRRCLNGIHSAFGKVYDHFATPPQPADQPHGRISQKWANILGIPETTMIGGSSLDAHAGAVGAGIRKGVMVVNIGTSTVNILVEDAPNLIDKDLTSVCGQAENSVLPGLIGIETSQAAFGDVYAWFQDLLMLPLDKLLRDVTDLNNDKQKQIIDEIKGRLLVVLEDEAAQLPIKDGVVALDWLNGRRYPDPNETLKSAMAGLSLGTGAGEIYQGLVMATAFGQKRILDRLLEAGIQIDEIIAVGGIAKKSPFVLQTLADVLGRPIKVSQAEYASARGAAIYAAVGAGVYASIPAAQEHLCLGFDKIYYPDSDQTMALSDAYQQYLRLGKWMEEEY